MKWENPKTIIGPPAEGDKYLRRPEINKLFWHAIANGEHILFTAPRRVGKSSVMKDLVQRAPDGVIAIYQNVESDKRSDEFYKRIWTLILNHLNRVDAWKTRLSTWVSSRRIGEISIEGTVKIENSELSFKQELLELVEEIGKGSDKVVLLLDEFPDVVNNVRKFEGDDSAIELLHVMRAIRHEAKFKNFSIVLAGSIGLEHVISSVDRIKLINDLRRLPIEALLESEVDELLNLILETATIQLDAGARGHLKRKVGYWLPFFFQLMIVKCNDIAYGLEQAVVGQQIIDQAFEAVLSENEHFSDWESRLRIYMSLEDYGYCIGLLTRCAHGNINLLQAFDFSKASIPTTGYKALIDDVLIKDGYLVLQENRLRFQSTFLEEWWRRRHPAYEID